jgi:hypothetical protein
MKMKKTDQKRIIISLNKTKLPNQIYLDELASAILTLLIKSSDDYVILFFEKIRSLPSHMERFTALAG